MNEWINSFILTLFSFAFQPQCLLNWNHHGPQYITLCFYGHQGRGKYSEIVSFILFNTNMFRRRKEREKKRWKINLCLWMSHILFLNDHQKKKSLIPVGLQSSRGPTSRFCSRNILRTRRLPCLIWKIENTCVNCLKQTNKQKKKQKIKVKK